VKAITPNPPPVEVAALKAAEKWCALASDGNRRAAFAAAEEATYGKPAGMAALAAFLSDGSMGPANVQAVPPAPHMTAKLVASAMTVLSVQTEPAKAAVKLKQFLDLGLTVADGANRWPESKPESPPQGRPRR
jgi:hypothetical protein